MNKLDIPEFIELLNKERVENYLEPVTLEQVMRRVSKRFDTDPDGKIRIIGDKAGLFKFLLHMLDKEFGNMTRLERERKSRVHTNSGKKNKKERVKPTRKKNKTKDEEHVYRRDVTSIRGAMRPSIESLDVMVTMLIDDDNQAWEKYWERRWKPDFPDGVEDFIDFERWFDVLVKKAKGMKRKTLLTDIVNTLTPNYYHVAKREDIGTVFEADGVNAEPECMTIPTYTITFTGTNLGPNVANDGVVVWPQKVISVEGPGDERLHVKALNKQIMKYYVKKRK